MCMIRNNFCYTCVLHSPLASNNVRLLDPIHTQGNNNVIKINNCPIGLYNDHLNEMCTTSLVAAVHKVKGHYEHM